MAWPPDVVQGCLRITETGDDGAPCVVLVVQQIRRVGRLPEVGDLAQAKLLVAVFVPSGVEVPRVDHVRDYLFFVRCVLGDGVARAHENPDVPVVPLRAALRHVGHELQPPAPRVAGGAAGNHIFILIGEHQHGQADLLEVVRQTVDCPFCLALASAGNSIAARIAIIAITTSNSINVKAPLSLEFRFMSNFIVWPNVLQRAMVSFRGTTQC